MVRAPLWLQLDATVSCREEQELRAAMRIAAGRPTTGVPQPLLDAAFIDAAGKATLREVCDAFGWSMKAKDLPKRLTEQGLATRDGLLTIAGALLLTDPREALRQNKAIVESKRTAILIEMRPAVVTVTSPGGLPEPVTVATMRHAQAARNQDLINALRRFRLAEDAGRGIDVMEDTMAAALLEPPRFSADSTSVRVELSIRGPITPRERAWVADLEPQDDIAATDRLLLVHAARGEHLTNKIARGILAASESDARQALQRLRDAGLLTQRGARGGATYALVHEIAPPAAYRMSPEQLADLVVAQAATTPIANEQVREIAGLGRQQALALLQRLVAEGRLEVTGTRRCTRYTAI